MQRSIILIVKLHFIHIRKVQLFEYNCMQMQYIVENL